MNLASQNYILELKRSQQASRGAFIFPISDSSGNACTLERYDNLARHALNSFGVDHREELANHGSDMQHWISSLELLLYQDLFDLCSQNERAILSQVAIGYLPMSIGNAFAETLATQNQMECSHVIGINLGLIWISNLLCEALLLESKGRSDEAFPLYRTALARCLGEAGSYFAQKIEVGDDQIGFDAGAVSSVVLRFVGLHEFAHIALNHTQDMDMHWDGSSRTVKYMAHSAGSKEQAKLQEMEFAADAFSIDHLICHTGSPQQMWNNTLFIKAFFRLLEHREFILGIPGCSYHPSPQERAKFIHNRVIAIFGEPANDALEWLDIVMEKWRLAK
jgi:hypothetical protein